TSRTPLTAGLLIDMGASFPIEQVTVQADRHEFQIDYKQLATDSWAPLMTVPAIVDGSGLITRDPVAFPAQSMPQARYLLVYGTDSSDNNFSVSSVQVLTPKAKTACAYNAGANSGQSLSCAYDGTLTTSIQIPPTGLPISFTIPSADAYLLCSNGTST